MLIKNLNSLMMQRALHDIYWLAITTSNSNYWIQMHCFLACSLKTQPLVMKHIKPQCDSLLLMKSRLSCAQWEKALPSEEKLDNKSILGWIECPIHPNITNICLE